MKWMLRLALAAALIVLAGMAFMHRAPHAAMELALTGERSMAGLTRKTITLPSGEHFAYLDGGQGEPLVLIHGFAGNKDNFVRVARYLTPHYRVVIPDLTGFGESSRPPNADYGTAAQAERLHQLAKALGLGDALHIGGNSMGGHIAMTWASLHPQQIRSQWLLDPGGVWKGPQSELMQRYRATGDMPLIATTEDEFLNLMRLAMNRPPFAPEPLLRAMAHENMPYKELHTGILQRISEEPVEPRLSGMKTPTLLVWGDQDRLLSVDTVPVLHELLPQAQVIIMKGIGHMPMLEDPAQAARDYLAFRAR